MAPIRVGIIGQGRSGRDIHASYLATVPDKYAIVAVADEIPERAARGGQEFHCDSTTNYRDLLKRDDLDLIINASFSFQHVPITKEILKSGHNALCEKPLARKAKDADDLIVLAKKSKKLLAIYQQSRFSPVYQKVRQVIESGVLGRIVEIKCAYNGFGRRWDWQTLQAMHGGNLLNTGPHPLDQMLMLFDAKAMPEVWCKMDRANTFGDAEDHVKLILSGKGKPTIDLEISSCCAYPLYTYQVFGTHGSLTGLGTQLKWKYFDPAKAPARKLIRQPLAGDKGQPIYCGEQLPWVEEAWDLPKEVADTMFPYMAGQLYDNLHAALTQGAPLTVTPQQVRRQIAVIEEAHRQNPLSKLKK